MEELDQRGRTDFSSLGAEFPASVSGLLGDSSASELRLSEQATSLPEPSTGYLLMPPLQPQPAAQLLTAEEKALIDSGDKQQLAALRREIWARLTPAHQVALKARLSGVDAHPHVHSLMPSRATASDAGTTTGLKRLDAAATSSQPSHKRSRIEASANHGVIIASSSISHVALDSQTVPVAAATASSRRDAAHVSISSSREHILSAKEAAPSEVLRHLPPPKGDKERAKVGLEQSRLKDFYSGDPHRLWRLEKNLANALLRARRRRADAKSHGRREEESEWDLKMDADEAVREGVRRIKDGMKPERAEKYAELMFEQRRAAKEPERRDEASGASSSRSQVQLPAFLSFFREPQVTGSIKERDLKRASSHDTPPSHSPSSSISSVTNFARFIKDLERHASTASSSKATHPDSR